MATSSVSATRASQARTHAALQAAVQAMAQASDAYRVDPTEANRRAFLAAHAACARACDAHGRQGAR